MSHSHTGLSWTENHTPIPEELSQTIPAGLAPRRLPVPSLPAALLTRSLSCLSASVSPSVKVTAGLDFVPPSLWQAEAATELESCSLRVFT